MSKTEVLISL